MAAAKKVFRSVALVEKILLTSDILFPISLLPKGYIRASTGKLDVK
jgi:hypothetical protein